MYPIKFSWSLQIFFINNIVDSEMYHPQVKKYKQLLNLPTRPESTALFESDYPANRLRVGFESAFDFTPWDMMAKKNTQLKLLIHVWKSIKTCCVWAASDITVFSKKIIIWSFLTDLALWKSSKKCILCWHKNNVLVYDKNLYKIFIYCTMGEQSS